MLRREQEIDEIDDIRLVLLDEASNLVALERNDRIDRVREHVSIGSRLRAKLGFKQRLDHRAGQSGQSQHGAVMRGEQFEQEPLVPRTLGSKDEIAARRPDGAHGTAHNALTGAWKSSRTSGMIADARDACAPEAAWRTCCRSRISSRMSASSCASGVRVSPFPSTVSSAIGAACQRARSDGPSSSFSAGS